MTDPAPRRTGVETQLSRAVVKFRLAALVYGALGGFWGRGGSR